MSPVFNGLSSFEYNIGARREMFETLHTEDLKTKFARWKNDGHSISEQGYMPNSHFVRRVLVLNEWLQ